jgi:hypothetical protein
MLGMVLKITENPLIQNPPTAKHSTQNMPYPYSPPHFRGKKSKTALKQSAKEFRKKSDNNRARRMSYTVPRSF